MRIHIPYTPLLILIATKLIQKHQNGYFELQQNLNNG